MSQPTHYWVRRVKWHTWSESTNSFSGSVSHVTHLVDHCVTPWPTLSGSHDTFDPLNELVDSLQVCHLTHKIVKRVTRRTKMNTHVGESLNPHKFSYVFQHFRQNFPLFHITWSSAVFVLRVWSSWMQLRWLWTPEFPFSSITGMFNDIWRYYHSKLCCIIVSLQ